MQVRMLPQEIHHVVGMGEVPGGELLVAHILGAVAPQGQAVAYVVALKLPRDPEQILLSAAYAGHMGHRIYPQGILDIGSDFHGLAGAAPAGPIGNADEIRGQLPQRVHHLKSGFKIPVLLRGEDFERKGGLVLEHVL